MQQHDVIGQLGQAISACCHPQLVLHRFLGLYVQRDPRHAQS
jgi:hypothetical protein